MRSHDDNDDKINLGSSNLILSTHILSNTRNGWSARYCHSDHLPSDYQKIL